MATSYICICVEVERPKEKLLAGPLKNLDENNNDKEPKGHTDVMKLANLVEAVGSGTTPGKVYCWGFDEAASMTFAAGKVTVADYTAAGTDTITFNMSSGGTNTVVLTEGTDFDAVTSNTVTGDNLANAINTHPVLKHVLTASNSSGDVTITHKIPGAVVPFLITTSDGTAFTIVAMGTEASAAIGTPDIWPRRIDR